MNDTIGYRDLLAYQAVLLDLDGTIYHEEHALPGAVELIRRLQADQRRFACLSNSTHSPQRVAARLRRMGIDLSPDRIFTAAAAAADYVLRNFGPTPRVYNLATEGLHDMLDGQVRWVEDVAEPCDAVVIGSPSSVFATPDRQRLAMILARRGARLVGICADRVFPSPRGLEIGGGALGSMLGYAADQAPVYCGKPEKIFFTRLCDRLGVAPEQCVLIGDNLESDIAGAKGVGMRVLLTLTGVASRQDAERLPEPMRPDGIVRDLEDLLREG